MVLAQTFHQFSTGAMGGVAQVALHAAIAAYLIAAVISLVAVFAPGKAKMAWADWTGAAGTISLLLYFAARVHEAGPAPLQNLFEVLALSALCLAVAYFAATRLKPMPLLGAFVFPALATVFLVSFLFVGSALQEAPEALRPLIALHVLLTIMAYGVFFMAAVAACLFLMQERALKRRHASRLARNLPPLESLRKLLGQCMWIGLGLLSAGFVLGFGGFPPAQWPGLALTPKVMTALVLWLVLLAIAGARLAGWLHGRKLSYMVLVGFSLVLVTYVGLALTVRAQQSARVATITEKP